ncbi:hypothetical protein B4U79_02676, partial [Dinothrombium tinctorium]
MSTFCKFNWISANAKKFNPLNPDIPTDRFFYRFPFGHYDQTPAYQRDVPRSNDFRGRIPFGLPVGGYSLKGVGPPYGLTAYLLGNGVQSMWRKYYADNAILLSASKKHYVGQPLTEYLGLRVRQ